MHKYLSVRDTMTRLPVAVGLNTLVSDCARIMLKEDVGSLIIEENNILKGIVTEKDLVNKIIARGEDPKKTKVKDIMEKNLVTIDPNKDIIEAIRIMSANDLRRLPVIENDNLVGLLTLKDILRVQPELFDIVLEKSRFLRSRNV